LFTARNRGVAPEFGMQIVLAWIIEALIEFAVVTIGYAVARVVLPLISFGRIAVEPVRGSGAPFNLLGYRRADGHIEVAAPTAAWIGLLAVCLALAFTINALR
jgi:hypothetical protein